MFALIVGRKSDMGVLPEEKEIKELRKELLLYKIKEKEWLKTYSEMKARLLGYEVNDIVHKIRRKGKKFVTCGYAVRTDNAKKKMKVRK